MTEALLEWIRAHGAIGIFIFIAVENLGVPWPTSLAFIVAIDLVRTGHLTFPEALVICSVAHVVGALAGYGMGTVGENAIVARARRGTRLRSAIDWLHQWYDRHGAVTVFAARLVGQVRPWASIAAGLGEIRAGPFLVWTTIGSLVQVIVALKLAEYGWWLWDQFPNWRVELATGVAVIFWGALIVVAVRAVLARRQQEDADTEEC